MRDIFGIPFSVTLNWKRFINKVYKALTGKTFAEKSRLRTPCQEISRLLQIRLDYHNLI